jgi:hypothetical protein
VALDHFVRLIDQPLALSDADAKRLLVLFELARLPFASLAPSFILIDGKYLPTAPT